jgi:vancomycin resistance protein YoaR
MRVSPPTTRAPVPTRSPAGGLLTPGRRRRRRRWVVVLAVAVAALAVAGAALGGLALVERGKLPAGTTVDGVDVGGLDRQAAIARIREHAAVLVERPITITGAGQPLSVTGAELGARPRIERVLRQAQSVGLFDRLLARVGIGGGSALPLGFKLDREALARVAGDIDAVVAVPPVDAALVVEGGVPRVEPAALGRGIDRQLFARQLGQLPQRLTAPVRTARPAISTAAAEQARRRAAAILREERLVGVGTTFVRLPPARLGATLQARAHGGRLSVEIDEAALAALLAPRLRKLERPPRDAGFRIDGARVRVIPAQPGLELDVPRIAASLESDTRSTVHRARFTAVAPDRTTSEAKRLGIRELVSEFTTPYSCCAPRVTNIQRGAEILDGTILPAGATFSLNEALGRRTAERGFVEAPMILQGRLVDSVGGGVSQIATTVFNAAFFAGLKLIAHTPHQFYISRYPMGREATVSWGGPELVFRNDWPAAILMKLVATDTSLTVRFYSSKLGRRVETETGEPYGYVAPRTITVSNPSLPPGAKVVEQSAGPSGFTVQYTRRVYRRDRLRRNERYTVRYEAENAFVEVGPPRKPEKPAKPAKPKRPGKADAPEGNAGTPAAEAATEEEPPAAAGGAGPAAAPTP